MTLSVLSLFAAGRNRSRLSATRAIGAFILASIALTGCAGVAHDESAQPSSPTTRFVGEPAWWQLRIRMGYDPQRPVAWSLDALIADRVFAPLVTRLGAALPLWRVHRRAVNDQAGHQLSFLFYADPAIAARVVNAVRRSSLVAALRDAGVVKAVLLPQPDESLGSALDATSDRQWPATIQRTWPLFIMGVSEHWLALIAEIREQHEPLPRDDLGALIERYVHIAAEVDRLWLEQAQHAYLHHLNAVFGYKPLLLQEQRLTRF